MTQDAEQLNQLEQRLIRAWTEQDRDTIDEILADDWSVIDPGGRVLTKAQVMAEAFDSGTRNVESGTIDEVEVRLFGNLAVVTGRTHAAGSYQGKHFSVQLRFTDVCEKQAGHWRVVASQGTLIAD